MPKAFFVDTSRCTACRGCQLACKDWHNLPANDTKQTGSHQNPPELNPYNLKIVRFNDYMDEKGVVHWNFFPEQCRHCVQPPCKDTADMTMEGAIVQDEATGAVIFTEMTQKLSAEDCESIREACPYNVPRRDEKTGMLTKCDMCIDRVGAGMVPMCVKTCPTGAMSFGEREEILEKAQKRLEVVKKDFPKAYLADPNDVNVIYLLVDTKDRYFPFASVQ